MINYALKKRELPVETKKDANNCVKVIENCSVNANSMMFLNAQINDTQCFIQPINFNCENLNLNHGSHLNEKILTACELSHVIRSRESVPVTIEKFNIDR